MIKQKKGITHIEMVISFAIFISFVVFMLIFFKPLKIPLKSSALLETTESKILEDVSTNLSVVSVKITPPNSQPTCYFLASDISEKIIVRDAAENRESANIGTGENAGKIYFEKSSSVENFYKIYSSDEFAEKDVSNTALCGEVQTSTLGVKKVYRKVSLSKLKAFFDAYNNPASYTPLKTNLGLKNDFNVFVRDNEGNIITYGNTEFKGENFKPSGVEIMAKELPIEILNGSADTMPAIINIRVWG